MNKKSPFLWIAAVLAALLVGVVAVSLMRTTSLTREVEEARLANEQLQLDNEQLRLTREFEDVNAGFAQYEIQARQLTNDTIYAKYTAAKNRVEKLMAELQSEKVKSRERIAQLQGEISTLKNLLRHYVARIDSLSRENAGLRAENQEIRATNEQLTSKVTEVSNRNEELSHRMSLAEKLNVTGVSLTALKKNGKAEKNVTKAAQLKVSFTIPQNNSTPVGNKTIYLRLVNPEGQLLGNGGTFAMDGGAVACSTKKTIEYSGDELQGVTMYWDVNTALTPGDYTVELFTDGYRLTSRRFTLKK